MGSKWLLLWLSLSLGTARAQSQEPVFQLGHIQVTRLRAPPTPPTSGVAAVYLWITNSGSKSDSLVAISSPIAAKAEMHSSTTAQGVMQMRPVQAVEIPPGAAIKFEPGALHIMLQGLRQPLEPGDVLSLTLAFRDAGMLLVHVPVKPLQ